MHSMQLERKKTLCAGLDVLVSNAGIGGEGKTVREDNIASAKKVTMLFRNTNASGTQCSIFVLFV